MEKIIRSLEETTADLLQTIGSFTQEDFNTIPFEGSWTAGQVAEHIFKSERGLPSVLSGGTKSTDRKPDEKVPAIDSIFLDFNIKMKSPEFILPSAEPHSKDEMIASFTKLKKEMLQLATVMDLSLTCTDYAFPNMGEFTRLEWLTFAIDHSTRHIRQMKNIQQHFANK